MENFSKAEILQMVEEEDVEFIRLQFTDMFGALKNIAIPSSQLMRAMDNGYMIDASSVEGVLRSRERWPDSCVIFTRRTGSPTRKAPDPF